MKYRLAVLIVLAAGAALWLVASRKPESAVHAANDVPPSLVQASKAAATPAPPETANRAIAPDAVAAAHWTETSTGPVPSKAKRAGLAAAAEPPSGPEVAPGLTPVTVLENMRAAFRQYSSRFGGNPVGINREITAALNGKNPQQVVFIEPEDGMRINARGELIDNWGTPYFFHQVSATKMEIHSAGPDKRMWTADDLVIE